MHPLITAYELGYHSGIYGEDPRLCPYPAMTAEAKMWHQAQRHGVNVRMNALSFASSYATS
jgi:ribosome modulation factor